MKPMMDSYLTAFSGSKQTLARRPLTVGRSALLILEASKAFAAATYDNLEPFQDLRFMSQYDFPNNAVGANHDPRPTFASLTFQIYQAEMYANLAISCRK